jgi:hypothetical protein
VRQLLIGLACLLHATLSFALGPYLAGDRQAAGPVAGQLTQLERKLQAEGFTVVGRHLPPGLPQHASLVVTDRAMLEVIAQAGGTAILGAGVRIGARSDGSVSYMNPEYWYRAYLRAGYDKAQPMVQALTQRLARALGTGAPFGGDVAAADLADYRYMFGMERIDSRRNELRRFESFDEALRTVQANLAQAVGKTAKVYEIVLPQQQLAVIGVALNDSAEGESWWAGKIGPDHEAALPYEIYIIGDKAHALYGRYRIALSWPALGMGQFMGIMRAPDAIHGTMERLAGVAPSN